MRKKIIIILGEPNSISSEIFLKSLIDIKKTKFNFVVIGNYELFNKQLEQEQKNSVDNEKFKNQLIIIEKNKLLNKFAATHLEKSKKKYLIKFL